MNLINLFKPREEKSAKDFILSQYFNDAKNKKMILSAAKKGAEDQGYLMNKYESLFKM